MIDCLHHYIRKLLLQRKIMEAVKKNDVKCAGPEEMKAREQQVDTLKEMIRQLEECKVKEASTSEATVEALKKQSEGLLLEYDRCDDAEQQKMKTVDTHPQGDNSKGRFYQKCKLIGTVHSDNKGDQRQQSNHPHRLTDFAGLRNEVLNDPAAKEASGLGLQDIRKVQPSFKPNAEPSSLIHLAKPGNWCFTGGLLGPDGADRYLEKWCNRTQNKGPSGSSNNTDSLISVGAGGRGGTVKVLRSLSQTTMFYKLSDGGREYRFSKKIQI
ncbi:uncharacterized protein LOC130823289 [Amaranthus tricolor]|uniref:uncharacterized protein LOC130823289 n=1 Tax=Amaranthus tricolor TaxID=29722 RepID=UPI002590A97E|nr:uncharacterized protein LOC130823289 [Amaranthus tricolor]